MEEQRVDFTSAEAFDTLVKRRIGRAVAILGVTCGVILVACLTVIRFWDLDECACGACSVMVFLGLWLGIC